MAKQNTLFIIAVYNLEIKENLGEGIELNNGFKLTNDTNFIKSLITDDLIFYIGQIEYSGLVSYADAVIYSIEEIDIDSFTVGDIYNRKFINAYSITHDLWMVKDHSIEMNIGFMQFPYFKPSKFIITKETNTLVHSNSYSFTNNSMSNGSISTTTYSKYELEKAIELGKNKIIASKNDIVPENKLNSRFTKASNFLQLARALPNLELKVANYCSAFECLFADDNMELSHKLSERMAFFLEDKPSERKTMFKFIKDAYGVRSKVIHGDTIPDSKRDYLIEMSVKCDEVLRRILNKLHDNPELDKFYRITHEGELKGQIKNEFQDYFSNLLFGI